MHLLVLLLLGPFRSETSLAHRHSRHAMHRNTTQPRLLFLQHRLRPLYYLWCSSSITSGKTANETRQSALMRIVSTRPNGLDSLTSRTLPSVTSTEHSMDQSLNLYCIYITMVYIPFGPKCSPDWPTIKFLEYIFPSFSDGVPNHSSQN